MGTTAASANARSGSSVVLDERAGMVWVAERDTAQLVGVRASGRGASRSIALSSGAEQILVAADGTIFATLPDVGAVARIPPGARQAAMEVVVGNGPYGLALNDEGTVLLVTLAGDDELVALDPSSLAETRRVPIERDPRGVAIVGDGTLAIVTHLTKGVVTRITMPHARALPQDTFVQRLIPLARPTDFRPISRDAQDGTHAHLALAIATDPEQRRVFIPHELEQTAPSWHSDGGTYGGVSENEPPPIVSAVSTLDVDGMSSLLDAEALSQGAHFGRGDRRCATALSQPSAATFDALGKRLFVAGLGSDAITALDVRYDAGGQRFCVRLPPGSGVRGLALDASGRWLYAHLSFRHQLAIIALPDARHEPVEVVASRMVTVGTETLSPDLVRGRQLFYSAGNAAQSKDGRVPCGCCHPAGGHDGLVWRIEGIPRQTPMLAGRVLGMAPYNWLGSRPTLKENIADTVKRLRGKGLAPSALDDLAAFVSRGLRAPTRVMHDPVLVARGRALFGGADQGCAHCHVPERGFTDGQLHNVGSAGSVDSKEQRIKTPSLRGIASSAPYLHNGSSASLRDLLSRWNDDDRMGRTSHLSPPQLDELIAYLRTL